MTDRVKSPRENKNMQLNNNSKQNPNSKIAT